MKARPGMQRTKKVGSKNLSAIKRSIQKNMSKRGEGEHSPAEKDYSWVTPGSMGISNHPLIISGSVTSTTNDAIKVLRRAAKEYCTYSRGTPFIYSYSIRSTVTSGSGPMRVVYHIWISPDGEKYTIPLNLLNSSEDDQDDQIHI